MTRRRTAARVRTIVGVTALAAGATWLALVARQRSGPVSHRTALSRRMKVARLGTRAGTQYAAHRARRAFASAERKEELDRRFEMQTADDVVRALGDMKGLLMKVGQMASFITDDVPEAFRDALAQLQRDAPPMSAGLSAEVVSRELGRPPEEVFAEWDPVPIAAASVGQVHRAITRDGRAVAVKVQYPGVGDAIGADLQNTELLFSVVTVLFKGLEPRPLVEEITERFTEELDYRREAANQRAFARIFASHPFISIPAVIDELSTGRVLTTELASGARLAEVGGWSQAERDLAGETVFRFGVRALERHGLMNGDAHPGNYLFRPGGRVTFLDFGLVKHLAESELAERHAAMRSHRARDAPAYRRALEEIGTLRRGAPFSDERILEYFTDDRPHPFAKDEPFTYTPEWAAAGVRRFLDPGGPEKDIKQWLNMSPSMVIVNRRNFGINAVLGRLRATANWYRISAEVLPWLNGAPSTPLGEEEAEWARSRSGQPGDGATQ